VRLAALAGVVALTLVLRALAPDPGARREWLVIAALGLGYGHQLGALWFGLRRRTRAPIEWALLATTAASVGVLFALLLASSVAPWLIVALALLAAWHVLENDAALGRGSARGVRLPPLPRACAPHLAACGAAAALVGLAWLAPRGAPIAVAAGIPVWLAAWTAEEVIAALLLYHAASWIGRALAASPPWGVARKRRAAAILLVHALPFALLGGARELAPAAFALAVAPPVYLLLSAAHAVHTCVERGLEPA
jgi:hypothetical protein